MLRRLGLTTTYATLPATSGDVAQVADLPPAIAEAFGINVDTERVSRREAKTIPAMRRGEQQITGPISSFPLVAQRVTTGEDGRTAEVLPDQVPVRRSLLEHPDVRYTAGGWKRRIVDDLVYLPYSWCWITGRDNDGFPRWLEHLDARFIQIDYSNEVLRYRGDVVPERQLVRFDSPGNGVLFDGAVTLRTALMLEAAVRRYASEPVPTGILRDPLSSTSTGRDQMPESSVKKILDKWAAGASKRATRWIGRLEYQKIQFDAAQIQLVEARQRSDVAIAQMLNLDNVRVNAPAESGMTYTNREAAAAEVVTAIRPYMDAITERLSMDDITPRGQRVTFDTTAYVRGTTTERIDAGTKATGAPIMTTDEARRRFLDLPPMPEEARADA